MTPRNLYRCHACGWESPFYTRMERHLDEVHDGHGRVDLGFTVKENT